MHAPTPTLSAYAAGRSIAPLWVAPNGRAFYPIAGGSEDTGADGGDKGGDPAAGGDKPDEGGKADAGKTYTAEDMTKAVEARVGELTRKHERELAQAREDAGKSDTQRIEAERDRATEAKNAAIQKAAPKVASALAQVAAISLGGRPDRAAAIVRQADLDGVAKFDGDDWTVDEAKVQEALSKVLDEYPEWKADTTDDKADKGEKREAQRSGGDLGGGGSEVTLDQFKAMSMGKRAEFKASDPEGYRRLADAEIDAAGKR